MFCLIARPVPTLFRSPAQSTESNLTQTLLHYSVWPSLANSAYALPYRTHMNLNHTAAVHTSNFLDANF